MGSGRETMAERAAVEDSQGTKSLDPQGTKSLDPQVTKSLDPQGTKSLDPQRTKSYGKMVTLRKGFGQAGGYTREDGSVYVGDLDSTGVRIGLGHLELPS